MICLVDQYMTWTYTLMYFLYFPIFLSLKFLWQIAWNSFLAQLNPLDMTHPTIVLTSAHCWYNHNYSSSAIPLFRLVPSFPPTTVVHPTTTVPDLGSIWDTRYVSCIMYWPTWPRPNKWSIASDVMYVRRKKTQTRYKVTQGLMGHFEVFWHVKYFFEN